MDGECAVALTWTEGDGVSDGSGVEVVQRASVVQVKPGLLRVYNKPAISFKDADQPLDDAAQQGVKLFLCGRLDRVKSEVSGFIRGVDPIQDEQVGMNVQIDRAAKSLNQRNTAALGATGSVEACPFDQVCFDRADDNYKASAQCLWLTGEKKPQRPGE